MGIAEKLVTIAENEQKVYEAGQQAEYDRFWDSYQQNGERVDYTNGFGSCWTKETFKPKYDIKPTNAYMFMRFAPLDKVDMVEHLEKLGITLDFSNCTNCQYGFYGAKISRLGVMDLRKIKGASAVGVLSTSYLKTIDLLKVSEEQTDLNWFSDTSALENITIEGVIDANLNMSKSSLLTHQSLMSIISALKDFRTYKTYAYNSSISHENISVCPDFYSTITVTNNYSDDYNLRLSGVDENNKEQSIEICFFNGTNDEFYHLAECPLADLEIKTFSCKPFEGAEDIALEYEFTYIKPYIENTTTKTLTLGSTNLEKLTDAEKKIATDKGWTLA